MSDEKRTWGEYFKTYKPVAYVYGLFKDKETSTRTLKNVGNIAGFLASIYFIQNHSNMIIQDVRTLMSQEEPNPTN